MNDYCESCGHEHGPLYICPSYSAERKALIQEKAARHRANLQDPEWIQRQLDKGVTREAIAVFQAFARVEPLA
jgi:hypothetical protein